MQCDSWLMFFLAQHNHDKQPEDSSYWLWCKITSAGLAFCLYPHPHIPLSFSLPFCPARMFSKIILISKFSFKYKGGFIHIYTSCARRQLIFFPWMYLWFKIPVLVRNYLFFFKLVWPSFICRFLFAAVSSIHHRQPSDRPWWMTFVFTATAGIMLEN